MHFCTFVIIRGDNDPDSAVARALKPFDEALEVEPYRDHLTTSEIRHMAARYGLQPTDLPALARTMQDWRRREGSVDDRGLYAVTTCNPDGRWDWYEIGGRWERHFPGSLDNVIGVPALLKWKQFRRCLPYYLLTPDGQWLEDRGALWSPSPPTDADREREARWFATVCNTLRPYRDHKVVCVDIHS